jgi:signal transduction histidine kinase
VVEAYSVGDADVQAAALSILQLIGSQLGQVAERERREHDLLAAVQAAESAGRQKSEFLSNMSHEFRTPMHAIINYTTLGQRALDRSDPERARRSLAAIQVSGKRLLTLLNDILDLAKMEAGGFSCRIVRGSFNMVVERALTEVEPLAAAKSIQLTRDLSHTDEARFDETRLTQVLVNLLSNAIKFSPPQSNICVRSSDGKLRGEPALVCRVEDQGVGIPANEFESIFDKFEQSQRTKSGSGGTGLGLAICRQIITAHQGVIFAENRPEGGAVFTVSFPRGAAPVSGAAE